MNWTDQGILLSAKPFGEGAALAQVLMRDHGRISGLVHGRRKNASLLQPGNSLAVTWRARLDDQLGTFSLEPRRSYGAEALSDGLALTALQSCLGLALATLPERDPHPAIYDGLDLILQHLTDKTVWPALLVRWELGLLGDLGFGLDLTKCALTGAREDLSFVSPRTGRAATRKAGEPFAEKLLALPAFLIEGQGVRPPGWPDIVAGLTLTGHFLEAWACAATGQALPEARSRLSERISALAKPAPTP